ncbi:MAG: SRPBCC family protein [Actinomycetota bacterium]
MAHFQRSIAIEAPVQAVYEHWSDPNNWPELWPSMIEVTEVDTTTDGLRSTMQWVYKMAGVRLEGRGVVERVPDQRIAYTTSGGVESTIVWAYEPEGDGTKVTADVEYTIPVPVLGKLLEPFVLKANEHEAEATLANFKARVEHRA